MNGRKYSTITQIMQARYSCLCVKNLIIGSAGKKEHGKFFSISLTLLNQKSYP